MTVTRLILIRHGQTEWNVAGRLQGSSDVPLNETGRAQARLPAPWIAALQPQAVVCSGLGRAIETAEAIAHVCGLPVSADERLREIHCGSWEGLAEAEVLAQYPEFRERLADGRDFRRSPTGETTAEVAYRAGIALREIAEAHEGRTVAVVGHGLALKAGAAFVMGWPVPAIASLGDLQNCSWSVLEQRAGLPWRLASYNNEAPAASDDIADAGARHLAGARG